VLQAKREVANIETDPSVLDAQVRTDERKYANSLGCAEKTSDVGIVERIGESKALRSPRDASTRKSLPGRAPPSEAGSCSVPTSGLKLYASAVNLAWAA